MEHEAGRPLADSVKELTRRTRRAFAGALLGAQVLPLTLQVDSILRLSEGPSVLQLLHHFLLLGIEALKLEAQLL